jgi:ubiquinone biosynthesis protein UbiJ
MSENGNGKNGLWKMIAAVVVSSALSGVGSAQIATARLDEQIKTLKDQVAALQVSQAEVIAERLRVRGLVSDRGNAIARLEAGVMHLDARLTAVEKEQARRTPYIPKRVIP